MNGDSFQTLSNRIEERTAHIGIVGLGYVGIPLARAFCRAGFAVNGFDIDRNRVQKLNGGHSPLQHIPGAEFERLVRDGIFYATDDFKLLRRMHVAIICVPTPLTPARDPDLSFVREATENIRRYMDSGMLVILESTTYPGTTEEVMLPILEESGLYCGEDFYLAFSPEREDPGNKQYSTATIPKLVGGVDEKSGKLAAMLYRSAIQEVIQVRDARTAEAAKILENIYRSVNIALVNELKMLFDRMGIDIWEVIKAASSKPFGFQAFYPGPGLGGHCIPIDPFYLAWRAREHGMPTRFIELAGEINTFMPEFVLGKVIGALNDRGKALSRSEILLLGVAYKRDVEDLRESPALRLMTLLSERGATVRYHDPHVPVLNGEHGTAAGMESVSLASDVIERADAVLVVTDHSAVDYEAVFRRARLVVDTRNVMARFDDGSGKVIRA